ncbi:major facilitator superfamily domain-containing protein [Dactylonectria estremocensis]|uniref:Major facilitator superfamily domain-containing protein n=1 Tax=Dactylonectria estremocensis TaxID=1079267 RepID=A0A9P9JG78_9HYPO|nr:major facilitator superfamily domain-containing protein [Dactylonectria estremocensis]
MTVQPENADETSGLLSSTASRQDAEFPRNDYGAVTSDCENSGVPVVAAVAEPKYSNSYIARVVAALLIGVFTSSIDASLVLATHPVIASEFGDLEDSSWLFISFMLAGAATQSLYGKLSDIFGRKSILMVCYGLFATGCALVGAGQTMWQVILGRLISGSGGAGMMALVSVIITDLAPLREVASWQSYLNVIATVGRSLGGPLGGWLADTIGWRWSFFGQAPIFLVAMLLCWILLPESTASSPAGRNIDMRSSLARIDGLGAFFLGSGILALMLPLEIGGQKVSWTHPLVFSLIGAGIVLLFLFVRVEATWAKEPIFPLRLFGRRNVTMSYFIVAAQNGAQLGMMYSVPIYFQVTQRVSSTVAGAHLFPAVIGNTVGGIVSGALIQRTGRYRNLILASSLFSMTSYSLMLFRWQGQTGWLESLYVVPGGVGTGIAQSAVFIALQAAIDPADRAVAASGMYLTGTIGCVVGLAASSSSTQVVLRRVVQTKLAQQGMDESLIEEVIKKATESVTYIDEAPRKVAQVLVEAYVKGIEYSHGKKYHLLSFGANSGPLVFSSLLCQRRLVARFA